MEKLTRKFTNTSKIKKEWERVTAIVLILATLLGLAWVQPEHSKEIISGLVTVLLYILARKYPNKGGKRDTDSSDSETGGD